MPPISIRMLLPAPTSRAVADSFLKSFAAEPATACATAVVGAIKVLWWPLAVSTDLAINIYGETIFEG